MAKRKIDFQEEESHTGYIYNISDVIESNDKRTKFFTGTFQTGKENAKRLVAFVPQKHAMFVQAATMNSPIKLRRTKVSPNKDGTLGIIVNPQTEIEISSTPLSFKKAENTKPRVTQAVSATDSNLAELKEKSEDFSASVHAKFLGYVESKRMVQTRYGPKQNQTGLLTDPSGTMRITAWEAKIPLLQQGQFYFIENLVLKRFDGELLLNTTNATKVTQIDEMDDIDENIDVNAFLGKETENIMIQHLEITSLTRCVNRSCNAVMHQISPTETTVRCTKCSRKQSVNSLKKSIRGSVTATGVNDSNEKQYLMFEEVITAFLQEQHKDHLINDVDRLEDLFLELSRFTIEHSMDGSIITKISVYNM